MTNRFYFLNEVLPQIPRSQQDAFYEHYPQITFDAGVTGVLPLADLPAVMLSALTGTGKTTTLNTLRDIDSPAYTDAVPGRRQIADFVVIPMAQALCDDAIQPVSDRERRFFYTRHFASIVPGGIAEAFSWLHMPPPGCPVLSDVIRGHQEIRYALAHCPEWHIIELTVDPLTRLLRLSQRTDTFDAIETAPDLASLPEELHAPVRHYLSQGRITLRAVAIVSAEAQNYSMNAYPETHLRYHHLSVDNQPPPVVAQKVATILKDEVSHA